MDKKPTYQELEDQVLGLQRALSDLRTAQEVIQEREDLYRDLLEKANDGIAVIQDWKVKYTNARLAAMLGLEVEDLDDADFLDFVLPEDRERVTGIHRRRLQDEKVPARIEFVVKHKSGIPLIVETSSSLVTYQKKPATFATIRDITDQKEAEQNLKEREESFRTLFELSFDGLMLHEMGTILKTNQTLSTMTGYEIEEISGMLVTELISFGQSR